MVRRRTCAVSNHEMRLILRDAAKATLLRMRSKIYSKDTDLILRSLRSKRLEGWMQRSD
jgi:hypothetical protein